MIIPAIDDTIKALTINSTGADQFKLFDVVVDVDSQTMQRNSVLDLQAEKHEFPLWRVKSGFVTLRKGLNSKSLKPALSCRLQSCHIGANTQTQSLKGNNWIDHQLARVVKGGVSAPIAANQFDSQPLELSRRGFEVRFKPGSTAQGDRRWMLKPK